MEKLVIDEGEVAGAEAVGVVVREVKVKGDDEIREKRVEVETEMESR